MRPPPGRPPANPVERVRDDHPTDREWRADALAGSRHSRLLDQLRLPLGERDPQRAARLCAEVCRNSLRDLAPALILLPGAERRRAQAVGAYALTLFDFARQSGLEGERLAQINRWQFHLEEALSGQGPDQPVFLRLEAEHRLRPWPQESLDRLADAARRRALARRPSTAEARTAEAETLAAALATALVGEAALPAAIDLAAAMLRLCSLLDLGEGLRRHDARLPIDELADGWHPGAPPSSHALDRAVSRECEQIRALLERARPQLAGLPRHWRRAGRFLLSAAARLLERVRQAGGDVARNPPGLGLGERLALLARARWLAFF